MNELSRTEQVKAAFERPHVYLDSNWYNIRLRALIVRELLGELDHCSILDIGAGDGSLSLPLLSANNRLTLLDLAEGMLDAARTKTPMQWQNQVRYIQSDFLQYDFDEVFDVALCIGVLAHVSSVDTAVARLAQVTRPGGRCVIQITDTAHPVSRLLVAPGSRRRRKLGYYATNPTPFSEIHKLAAKNGLQLEAKRQYLIPIPGYQRLPASWLRRYLLLSLRIKPLSLLGVEKIVLFTRRDG